MKKLWVLMVGCILVVRPSFAFDKDAFAVHLRKALNLDTRADIKIPNDPVPSNFGDLIMVTALVGGAPYPVYLSKDEKQYLWGFVVDATKDPDKVRADLIGLKKIHAQGSINAPVIVVEYSDLQCAHCKQAHETLKKELYKAYTKDQVRFIYKHFPLNGHDWAEPAAVACECAAAQKEATFWDMENFFFGNQEKINKDNVKEKSLSEAKTLGLDSAALEKCLAAGPALEKVTADKKEGAAVGVNSTPSIFINGRNRRGFRDFEDVKVVVEEKLKEAKK